MGVLDLIFGPIKEDSSSSSTSPWIFGSPETRQTKPSFSTPTGHGGRPYGTPEEADKSRLRDYYGGVVTDQHTGWTGTPQELHDKYTEFGMSTDPLHDQFDW